MRFAIALLLAMCACKSSSTKQVVGPDGQTWLAISCRGSQANCWERAGQECPNGYEVTGQHEQQGMVLYASQYSATAAPTYHGDMLVKCK